MYDYSTEDEFIYVDDYVDDFSKETDTDADSVFGISIPPWYVGEVSDVEREAIKDGVISDTLLDNIVDSAFNALSKNFTDYVKRDTQIEMSKKILRSVFHKQTCVIEAETGIGKSFAYLISALAFSYLKGSRVFISTETKNLQAQLYYKDITLLEKTLNLKSEHILCLGASNYFCQLRYNDSMSHPDFQRLSSSKKDELKNWTENVLKYKKQGNIFELDINLPYNIWGHINRDSNGCPHSKCSYYNNCNYFHTRKRWFYARILLGNHHLFFYNILNENKILPQVDMIVIDEAHGFQPIGMNIFTMSFSNQVISEQYRNLELALKKTPNIPQTLHEKIIEEWQTLIPLWHNFFQAWEENLNLTLQSSTSQIIQTQYDSPTKELTQALKTAQKTVHHILEEELDNTTLNTYNTIYKFLEKSISFILSYSELDLENNIYWAEKKEAILFLKFCPYSIQKHLSKSIEAPTLFTSATLGFLNNTTRSDNLEAIINQGYFQSFLKDILPKSSIPQEQAIYKSHYNYKEQSLLYINPSIEEPSWNKDRTYHDKYIQNLASEILHLIEFSKGGALVLFTSKYLLSKVHEILEFQTSLTIFSQVEIGSPHKALEFFTKDSSSVLFGLSSFWQGVDISGNGLRMLIITKLMFPPLNDPIFQATKQKIDRENGKSFFELSLPKANLMLRQAFGRLIRSETDQGVIAILDSRLRTKSYGNIIINNLPDMPIISTFQDLEKQCSFFKNKDSYVENEV